MEMSSPPFPHPRLTMKSTCSSCPVADVICRTTELGLTIEGAFIDEGDVTVIRARPVRCSRSVRPVEPKESFVITLLVCSPIFLWPGTPAGYTCVCRATGVSGLSARR